MMTGDGAGKGRARLGYVALMLGGIVALFLYGLLIQIDVNGIAIRYFWTQDRFVLLGMVIACVILALVARQEGQGARVPSLPLPTTPVWVALLVLMALALWWGTYALMGNYALTRDEHMVLFDMAVFAKGHMAEPLDPFWRSNPLVVVPAFLLQPINPIGLVSGYLPGNAFLRLCFSRIADPALMNPMLAAMGGLALLDIARRLFPGDRAAIAIAMLIYFSSAQMLVTAMTAYAMTPHMALNLIWLAAFLRGGKSGHVLALIVGACAMGLHQIIFHPLFVAPFLLCQLVKREWRVLAFYIGGYLIAAAFWTHYPALASVEAVAPGTAGGGFSADFLRDRVLPLLLHRNPFTLLTMSYNLSRFIAWQNLALLPLLIAAWPAVRHGRGIAIPLLAGIAVTLLIIGFLLPYQGMGWGYRYLHGFLGSFALLCGYGWQVLRDRSDGGGCFAIALLALGSAVTATPWLLWQAHSFTMPYVALDTLVQHARTDMVLVDTEPPSAAIDQVRNLPDLSNKPLRLSSRRLSPAEMGVLCARGTISLVTRADMHRVPFAQDMPEESPRFDMLVAAIRGKSCLRTPEGH